MNMDDIRQKNLRNDVKLKEAVYMILKCIGEDPDREGLKRTPFRFAKACEEWFGGYGKEPKDVFNRLFPAEGYSDMVVIKDIDFTSFCEHHMALFPGTVHIGVIYKDKLTGLDKYAKLVDIYARRLQTQEVMTQQIGEGIRTVLKPEGIIVVVEGKHSCVFSRETKKENLKFITTYRFGLFEEDNRLENRFLQYIK